jgi:hypothetical protein
MMSALKRSLISITERPEPLPRGQPFVFGWEAMNFLLPPFLKKVSVIYYLESLCPVPVSLGPIGIPADAPSPWLAIPGLFLLTAVLLAISAWKIKRLEISYEED